ncbi:MAG: PKD domain-containing protein, partial [Thermodesulfobacteriota bacterium]
MKKTLRLALPFCIAWILAVGPSARAGAAGDPYADAVRNADSLIADFERAADSGREAAAREAALRLQKDPIAVQRVNQKGSDALKGRLNGVLDSVKDRTRELARERIAKHYGVKPEEVTFFEATNPSAKPKVGQDWDLTARVRGMDVPVEVSRPVVHDSYYEAYHGGKAPTREAASAFAEGQAVEVTDYRHREAYGGSRSEGSRIITGPKDQQLRDPAQISKAIEDKSNAPRQKAIELERMGRHNEAQGQWLEQARQYDKQFDRQIKPRVEAAGGKVPQQVVKGSAILKEVAEGRISPAEGRQRLAAMGETPESIINKGAGLVEESQKLRAPGSKGPAAPDVVVDNVRDRMELSRLERAAKEKAALDAGGKSPAAATVEPVEAPGKGTGAKPRPAAQNAPSRSGAAGPAEKPAAGSAGRVGNAVGGALGLADLYVNYQACVAEGRGDQECFKEFAFVVMGGGVAAGAGGVAFETLAALGVSTATMTALTTAMTAAGIPLAAYGVYKGGMRWAEAPAVEAENRLRQQQKELLPRFGELAGGVRGEIQGLRSLAARHGGLCGKLSAQGASAKALREETEALAGQLKTAAEAVVAQSRGCAGGAAVAAEIAALRTSVKGQEERVAGDIEIALAAAGSCSGKADADKIRSIYDKCKGTAAGMAAASTAARGRNKRLGDLKAAADGAASRLAAAEDIRARMGANNAAIHAIAAERTAGNEALKALRGEMAAKRAAIEARIGHLAGLLPENAPSPVYREELERSLNDVAVLRNDLHETPAPLECAAQEGEAAPVAQWSLEMENLFAGADGLFAKAREAARGCEAVATAEDAVGEIEAAAQRAREAVGRNAHLPERAAACAAGDRTALGAAIGGPAQARIGTAVTLVANVTLGGAPVNEADGYTFRWETSDGRSVAGKRSVTFTPRTPGHKRVTLIVGDAKGRSATAAAAIFVPKPLSVSIGADRQPAAAGEQVTLSAAVGDEAELCPCTFQWRSDAAAPQGSTKSVRLTYPRAGSYTVALTAVDRYGQSAATTHTVTVKDPPATKDAAGFRAVPRNAEEESLRLERLRQAEKDRQLRQAKEERDRRAAEEERLRLQREEQERIRE